MHKEPKNKPLEQPDVSGSYFLVMHPMNEDWEQLSIAFKTIEEALSYFKNVNRTKYPHPRIMLELNCR